MDPTETKLVRNNFIAFVLHLVIGISFFVVMQTSESNLIGIETSTYTLEPVYRNVDSEVEQVGFDTQKQSSDLSLSSLILAFVLITAAFHFMISAVKMVRNAYLRNIKNEQNPLRWLEYSITASIMLLIVSFSLGLREYNSLILMFFLNGLVMIQGYAIEVLLNSGQFTAAKILTYASWVAYGSYWFVLIKTAWNSSSKLSEFIKEEQVRLDNTPNEEGQGRLPELKDLKALIMSVTITIGLLYTSFAVVQCVQVHRKSQNTVINYANYENAYVILSLVSKTTLVSLMFWGLYGRSQNNEKIE
jgi:hypothetical protein